MISYLKGKVIAQGPDYIITDVAGVGYKVKVAENRLASLPVGKEAELYCYLHLKREETLELYGLESPQALDLFETLNGISGIGPKAALAISSLGTMAQLKEAIGKGDASYFSRVHGIGQKKIQKIILELTGKLTSLNRQNKGGADEQEAADALVALGFPRGRAQEALSRVPPEIVKTEERVREALKRIRR
ncbi:MAG: Holliday junction branch migration protein RuvA [bacterium]|nr:Holliday junction branch migration protein RuvA [bacterium]